MKPFRGESRYLDTIFEKHLDGDQKIENNLCDPIKIQENFYVSCGNFSIYIPFLGLEISCHPYAMDRRANQHRMRGFETKCTCSTFVRKDFGNKLDLEEV